MSRILVIDDDPIILDTLQMCLSIYGHTVGCIKDGARSISAIREFKPDLVILDILMPGITGAMVYNAIRNEIGAELPVIVSSGTNVRFSESAQDPNIVYLPKPTDADELAKLVKRMLDDPSPGPEV